MCETQFFFLSWFSFTDTDDSQHSRGWERTIFYSTLPLPPAHENSDIYFVTLHVRWLSNISNRTTCIYQADARWDLLPYRITICVIDDAMLILFVYLLISFRVWLRQLVWCHKKLELPIIKTPQSQCSGKLGLGSLILSMN